MASIANQNANSPIVIKTPTDVTEHPFGGFVVAPATAVGETPSSQTTVAIKLDGTGSFVDTSHMSTPDTVKGTLSFTGTISAATSWLQQITYTPGVYPDRGHALTVHASATDGSSSNAQALELVTAGLLIGATSQPGTVGSPVEPFASVTIQDDSTNMEVIKIQELVGTGSPSDAAGELTSPNTGVLTETQPGIYTLHRVDSGHVFIGNDLKNLTFTPTAVATGQAVQFILTMENDQGLTTTDSNTEIDVAGQPPTQPPGGGTPPAGAMTISAPATATVGLSQANPVGPINITDTSADSVGSIHGISVIVSDTTGVLSATAGSGGDTVVPTDSGKTLTITGTQAQVNADLTGLTDKESVTSDTITINASDSSGSKATPVTIAVTANSVPTITAPASVPISSGQATAISGVSIAEDGNTTTGFTNQPGGEMFTVILTDTKGVLSAKFGTDGGGVITPSTDGTMLKIGGSLHDINADLKTLTDTATTPDTITVLASDQFGNNAAAKQIAVTSGGPPPYVMPLGPPNNFLVNGFQSQGEAYTGPVTGIDRDIIMITPDNLNVMAEIPNVFIHTGSGNDGIQALAGTNVLDGSTGSNFLTAGSDHDEFYVDDRNAAAPTWTSVVGLHPGDLATIWTPPDFGITALTQKDFQAPHTMTATGLNLVTSDAQGAPGFTGLTIGITAPGKPDANLTLAGYTTADLINGRLSITFGHTGDLPNLPGSDFMQIHAA